MWFHAIGSRVDLLVLSYEGPFTLERVEWGSIENITHSGETDPAQP